MANPAIGIIGLGNMGHGMAQTLIRNGFTVYGSDLGADQRERAQAMGVNVVDSIEALCRKATTVLLSLPTARHVRQVITGADGVLGHAQRGTLLIDTSTSEPDVSKALAEQLSDAGLHWLDAPVSGGPAGAAAGTMVMLMGGEAALLERAGAITDALCTKVVHMGPAGSGHSAKLINNLLCAAHLLTTAEAVAIGQQSGLAPEALIEGLNAGSGRSGVSEVNFPKWVLNDGFDSGFTMQLMRKDLRLARELIDKAGVRTPLADATTKQWANSEAQLPDDEDFNRIVQTVGQKS